MGNAALTIPFSEDISQSAINAVHHIPSGGTTAGTPASMFAGMSSEFRLVQNLDGSEDLSDDSVEHRLSGAITVGESRLSISQRALCQTVLKSSVLSSTRPSVQIQNSESNSEKETTPKLSSPFPILTKSYKFAGREPNSALESSVARLASLRVAICSQLHPNLLTYHKANFMDGTPQYIYRQWVDRTLIDRIKSPPELLPVELRWLMFQMICSMAELHSCGVSHGSVSVSNFLITATGHLFLTDIGSYYKPYLIHLDSASTVVATFYETSTQWRTGTSYIAPERFDCSSLFPSPPKRRKAKHSENGSSRMPDPVLPHPTSAPISVTSIQSEDSESGREFTHDLTASASEPTSPCYPNSLEGGEAKHVVASSHHAASGASFIENVFSSDIFALGCCIAEIFRNGRRVMSLQDAVTLGIEIAKQKAPPIGSQFRTPRIRYPSDFMFASMPRNEDPNRWFLTREMLAIQDDSILQLITAMCAPDPHTRPSAVQCLKLGKDLGLFCDSFYELYLPLYSLTQHPFLQFPDMSLIFSRGIISRFPIKPPSRKPWSRRAALSDSCRSDDDIKESHIPRRMRRQHQRYLKREAGAKTRLNALMIFDTLLNSLISLPEWCVNSDIPKSPNRQRRSTQSAVSTFPETGNGMSNNTDSPYDLSESGEQDNGKSERQGPVRQKKRKFDSIYRFMGLWKKRREYLLSHPSSSGRIVNTLNGIPMPFFSPSSGQKFCDQLLKYWETSFDRCRNTLRQRADIWPIGEHRGVFLWPERKCMDWSNRESHSLIRGMYDRIRDDEDLLDDYSGESVICLLNFVVPNVVDAKSPDVRRLGFQMLCELGRVCLTFDNSMSTKIIFNRIFPILLDSLEDSNDNIKCAALFHICHLCRDLNWDSVSAPFIADCILPPLYSLAIDPNPFCRFAATQAIPKFLRCLTRVAKLVPEYLPSVESALQNFLHPLLLSGSADHRLTVLNSCQSLTCLLPKKDLLELVLPFLISFLNSSTTNVRVVFCLRAFDLLPPQPSHTAPQLTRRSGAKQENEIVYMDLERIMTVAAALVPCFEGALGDSDELVVEAALLGLRLFFTKRLPPFPHSFPTGVFSPLTFGLSSCIRRIARQLSVKVGPLSLHPNRGIVDEAETLLVAMNNICLAQVASFVNLYQPFITQLCFKDSVQHPTDFFDVFACRFNSLSRLELYQLALSQDWNRQDDDDDDSHRRRLALLPHIRQAIKPSAAIQLSRISALHRIDQKISSKVTFAHIQSAELTTDDSQPSDPIITLNSTDTTRDSNSSTYETHNHQINSFDDSPSRELIFRAIPIQITSDVQPNWDIFSRAELPIGSSLLSQSVPSIDDALFNDVRLCSTNRKEYDDIVCSDCLHHSYDQQPHSLKFKSRTYQNQSDPPETTWDFRDWRYRALNLPEPNWTQFAKVVTPPINSNKIESSNEQTSPGLQRSASEIPLSVTSRPSISQLSGSQNAALSPQRFAVPVVPPPHSSETGRIMLKGATDILSSSQLPPSQTLLDHRRMTTRSYETFSRVPTRHPLIRPIAGSPKIPSESRTVIEHPTHRVAWRPRGVLAATIYRHESSARVSPGRSLGFAMTPDCRLLISGLKNSGTSRISDPDGRLNRFYIWNCEAFEKNVERAGVRTIEFCPSVASTEFRLLEQRASLLIGTDKGHVGIYPLEPSRGGRASSNILSQMPSGFSFCDFKKYSSSDPAVVGLGTLETSLEQVICSLHRGGELGCWDSRSPAISSRFSVPRWMGYPTCLTVGTGGRALHVGTIGGYLLTFDLRYRLMVQTLRAKVAGRPVSILSSETSELSQFSSSLILSLGSRRNEVCVLDPISGLVHWVFLSSHRPSSKIVDQNSERHILSDLALPTFDFVDPSPQHYNGDDIKLAIRNADIGGEGNVIALWRPKERRPSDQTHDDIILTGGTDRRVRLLDISRPVNQSYVVVGHQEYESLAYSSVPIFTGKKTTDRFPNDIWKFTPIVTVERIHSESKTFSLKPRHLKQRKSSFKYDARPLLEDPHGSTSLPSGSNNHHFDASSYPVPNSEEPLLKPFAFPCSPSSIQRIGRSISGSVANDCSHTDAITAISVVKNDSSNLLVTGGRDGLIKIWT